MPSQVQTLKLLLIVALILASAYVVVQKTLWEGFVFFLFGFLALYLWIFLECCWTENQHCEILREELKKKKK
ncbi:hypothetical protein HY485_00285 [Candidatus Woesearchaeota archaeon]|nr:hypothetical protein [Candidatus Woesearchaeota archaeon]